MATIYKDSAVTIALGIGEKLTIVTAASSTAIVERYQGDTLLGKPGMAASETAIYGPYLVEMNFRITCLTGSLSYTESQITDMPGEYVSSSVAIGSAVALTTNTDANVTTISLTAGEWDVSGVVGFAPGATTSMTHVSSSVSTTSATSGNGGTQGAISFPEIVPGATTEWFLPTPTVRLSLTATTTVYLVAHALFTVSTLGAYGTLRATRIR